MQLYFPISTVVLALATFLPLSRSGARWIRIFDFPVIQLAVWTSANLALLAAGKGTRGRAPGVAAAVLIACLLRQFTRLLPYLPGNRKQVKRAGRGRDPLNDLTLLIANVLMTNRRADALKELVRRADPDVVLLTEPDAWWDEALRDLHGDYPHQIRVPQENTYGMLLLSRLPLEKHEVHTLIHSDVPSIRAKVRLRSGRIVDMFCVHPRPPSEADARFRDAELLLAARRMKDSPYPGIVAGDLNDVAWSRTTRLFQKESRMLDPRVGRGFYNTYHAGHAFLRYPLDHIFHAEHFSLVDLRRLPSPGSDHFPILVTLNLDPAAPARQEPLPEDEGDRREADRKLRDGNAA